MKDLKHRICRKSNSVPTLVSLIVVHHCQSPGRLMKSVKCLPRGSGRDRYRERSVEEVMDNARTFAALTFLFMDLASSQKLNASPSCKLTVCISKTHQISLSDEHKVTC